MRKQLNPFSGPGKVYTPRAVGGSVPKVQAASEGIASAGAPMAASRIYAAPALAHYDESDPRFEGKANNVENIYLPAAEKPEPRSGVAQIFNWLLNGRMS